MQILIYLSLFVKHFLRKEYRRCFIASFLLFPPHFCHVQKAPPSATAADKTGAMKPSCRGFYLTYWRDSGDKVIDTI